MIIVKETIEERERHFREAVMTKNHEILMDEKTLEDFLDYWTQETTHKKEAVMLWEKRLKTSAFAIGNRMAYWKRANPVKVPVGEKFPDYWNSLYDKKLGDIQKQQAYRKHLRGLGYRFSHSPTAGEIITAPRPPK